VRRRAIAIAAVVVVAFFAVTIVTQAHVVTSSNQGCTTPAPLPNLPAQLRALGGFDQSFDATNADELAEVASNAAGAVDPDLDGSTPLAPVGVGALDAGQPEAVVIPLQSQQSGVGGTRVAGLVSFFVGCGARAYFGSVEDLSAIGAATSDAFPAVGESTAAADLGGPTLQLVYTTSPFMPEWRNPQSGKTLSAGE
jgi:hypothetical protein